jgi:hypothetical protein
MWRTNRTFLAVERQPHDGSSALNFDAVAEVEWNG